MKAKNFTFIVVVLSFLFNASIGLGQGNVSKEVREKLLLDYQKIKKPEITFEKFVEINSHVYTKPVAQRATALRTQDPYCSKVRPYCTNGTFENGLDQNQYVGAYGYWYSGLYPDPFSLTYGFSSGDLFDASAHQTIVDTTMGNDPIAGIRLTPANGQKYSLRLGNAINGYGTELIAKTITVDPNESILNFYYAVVLQDPFHSFNDQPAFSVRAYDCATGQEIPNVCDLGNGSNIAVSDVNNPFFKSKIYAGESLAYRDWSKAQVNLSNYVGKDIIIVFTVKDCNLGGHFGYAYLDNLFSSKCPEPPIPGDPVLTQGDVKKDTVHTDSCGVGRICAKYLLPYKVSATGDTTFGNVTISLDIYQNGSPTPVKTITSSAITTYSSDSTYCFSINPANLGLNTTSLGGFDYTLTGRFLLTGFSPSPIIAGNPGTGVKAGTNNDYMFNCGFFYSKSSGPLNVEATWGSNPNGTGDSPADFGFGKTFNLTNRGSVYTLINSWSVGGIINIPSGSQLQLNGFTLSEAGLTGTGTLTGSPTSSLTITGSHGGSAGTLKFTSGGSNLNNLTLNRTGTSASATIGSSLSIIGVLTVNNGTLNTGNFITLKSSATNTARVAPIPSTGNISGMVTVERYIPARKAWRILAAPVSGTQTINAAWQEGVTTSSPNPNPNPGYGTQITGGTVANGFDQAPAASSSIKRYNSVTDSWVPVPNTNTTAVNDTAFMVFVAGNRTLNPSNTTSPATSTTLRSRGSLKIGDQTFSVPSNGFVAIKNPYASPINFATITRSNVQNSFYVWDPKMGGANGVGAYVNISWNGSSYDVTPASVSPESQYIQSGQGFLVHSTGSAGSIVIKETDKSGTPATNVFRTVASTDPGLRINLQLADKTANTTVLDEVFASFSHKFSDKVDEFDVIKFTNIQEDLSIVRENQKLMVERRDLITKTLTLNLNLLNVSEKEYFFEFNPLNMDNNELTAVLEDKYLHTSTPISLNSVSQNYFKVTSDAGSKQADRFKVVISAKTSLPITGEKTQMKVSPNPVKVGGLVNLQLVNQPAGSYNISIVNSTGSTMMENIFKHAGGSVVKPIQLGSNLSKGVYQIVVTNGVSKNVLKVLVH